MRRRVTKIILAALVALGIGGTALTMTGGSEAVYADGLSTMNEFVSGANDGNKTDLMEVLKVVINVVIGVVGLIAVAMIVVGGINFTTSQGDPQKTKKAKDTILYGVIGLVVALLAFAVVNFVLTSVFNQGF